MIINGRNLCIGCMELLGDNEVECSHCGLNQRKYNPIPRCLGVGSELKERYVTGKVLGEGAFGITYMGWDKRLNISVAIKEFFPCDMVSRDVICGANNAVYLYESKKKKSYQKLLDKFYYEAQCLSRFNQIDGIVSVLDFFYENNTAYIVMEYIDGISLKQYIHDNGKMDIKTVLNKMEPVLKAMEQVHNAGLVHRDISPDNIMYRKDGSLVLIDFGAARVRNVDMTRTMTIMFKRGYSPQEQYRCMGKWGAYTDIYSLSATMYYMLTGVTPTDAVIRALGDELVPLKGAPECQVIMTGMAVNANERWQTVGEFIENLYGENTVNKGRRWLYRGVYACGALVLMITAGVITLKNVGGRENGSLPVSGRAVNYNNVVHSNKNNSVTQSSNQETEKLYKLPQMKGMKIKQVKKKLIKYQGIKVKWKKQYSETVKKGLIIKQNKPKGTEFSRSNPLTVTLIASKGKKKYKIPQLTGMNLGEAQSKMKALNMKMTIEYQFSELSEGTVLSQSIQAGKKVAKKSKIVICVSKGKKKTERNNTREQAKKNGFAGIVGA